MGNSESANTLTTKDVRKQYPVHLNVYKPVPSGDKLNDVAASTPGLGVYHSGVEVHDAGKILD